MTNDSLIERIERIERWIDFWETIETEWTRQRTEAMGDASTRKDEAVAQPDVRPSPASPSEISVDDTRAEFEAVLGRHMEPEENFWAKDANGNYIYKTAYGAWLGWKAALLVRAPKSVSKVESALEAAAEILANYKTQTNKDCEAKLHEWQACYAMLFKQMNDLVNAKSAEQPVHHCRRCGHIFPKDCRCGIEQQPDEMKALRAENELLKKLYDAASMSAFRATNALLNASVRELGWLPIETAPKDGTVIMLQTSGRHILAARWESGFINSDEEPCNCWVEAYEDTAPESWTDGVCWASNEDEEPSDPPIRWAPMLHNPTDIEGGES